MPDLRITRTVVIPEDELSWRFSPSGGPGGQHANRASTRVELIWNPTTSRALGPIQRERVVTALGGRIDASGTIIVAADRRRSQLQNREEARERLRRLVASALVPPKERSPTRPTKASKEKRLEAKRRRGQKKLLRRDPDQD